MLIFLQYFRLRTEKLSNKSQDGDSGAFDQTFALITWSVDSRWGKEAATAHGATHSNSQTATVVSGVVDSACLATQSTCAHTSTPCHACHKMLNKLNVLFFRCVTCSAPLTPPVTAPPPSGRLDVFIVYTNVQSSSAWVMCIASFVICLLNDSPPFLLLLSCSDSSTLQRRHHQQQQQQRLEMAPSVCDTSPKLPPPPSSTAAGGAGKAQTTASASASASALSSKCGASSLNGSLASYKMAGSEQSWPQAPVYSKENQRPPVYNPEDYVLSLRKFTKGSGTAKVQSIYDVNINSGAKEEAYKAATLPAKHTGYK